MVLLLCSLARFEISDREPLLDVRELLSLSFAAHEAADKARKWFTFLA